MFKSIQDRFRSFLSSSADDEKHQDRGKRKRSFCENPDEDDPDVQINKFVKRRKTESHSSFFGLFSLPSKMGDWMKHKSKSFSDQFATTSTKQKGSKSSKTNGIPPRVPNSYMSKGLDCRVQQQKGVCLNESVQHGISPAHNVNDANTSQWNGERQSFLLARSRSSRNNSSIVQCIRLKERDEYHKLLRLQARLYSAPPRMLALSEESDSLSDSSSSSKVSSQSRQLSNTQHHRNVPCKTPSMESSARNFIKSRPSDLSRLSMSTLLSEQRRRLKLNTPVSKTKPEASTSHQKESKSSTENSDNLVVIDDDYDDDSNDISNVNKQVPNGSDLKSSAETKIINNGVSSKNQFESLDFSNSFYINGNYIEKLKNSRLMHNEQWKRQVEEEEMKANAYEEKRRAQRLDLEKRLKLQMRIFDEEPEVSQEILIGKEEEEVEKVLPELTDSMMEVVKSSLKPGRPDEVLSEAFRLQITRRDMATLAGLNWLNDEIINFYMNMLIERSEQEGMAKVYAFNTFFYPKIMTGGHSAVKRWTKKVDIFAMHYILIPVHLGMHWCLCVADIKDKKITYYDSMGAENQNCLTAVLNYINDESVAKKQQPIKSSEWELETAQDIPQQLNGSDCGVFSCKYAEYVTRGKKITFTQNDMPYFRQRMVYEIKTKRLLQ